jgi:hypothetical protein
MKALDVMKRSFRTALANRRLWLFGFFVAAASSGSGGGDAGASAPAAGAPAAEIPAWVVPVIVAAAIVALAGLAMHVISEAALIDGVGGGRPETYRFRQGLRAGGHCFLRVLGLKALRGLVTALSLAVAATPAVLGALGAIPLWIGIAATLPLILFAVPWLLTLHFLYEYALRYAVLDGAGAIAAIRLAEDHLHGRIGESLVLLCVSLLGVPASGAAMALAAIPCAAVGVGVFFAAGPIAGIATGAALLLPFAICILGALGTYRSSVWTLGFLEAEGASA